MRIARGRLDSAVTEQPADDRQALAERERPRSESLAEVMNAYTLEPADLVRKPACRNAAGIRTE